jgi:hypothetical protein
MVAWRLTIARSSPSIRHEQCRRGTIPRLEHGLSSSNNRAHHGWHNVSDNKRDH